MTKSKRSLIGADFDATRLLADAEWLYRLAADCRRDGLRDVSDIYLRASVALTMLADEIQVEEEVARG